MRLQEARNAKDREIEKERDLIDQWKKEGERRIRKEVEGEVEERVREFRELLEREMAERIRKAKARNAEKLQEHEDKL